MEREDALKKLSLLKGQDLNALAATYEVTVKTAAGQTNKGWAGHVCERYLGIPLNSAQSPNFGSWELKSIPLKRMKNGELAFKETMAITMIDPYQVARTPFEQSHLLAKLKKAVCVARMVGTADEPSVVYSVTPIDLTGDLYLAVKKDYEAVQDCINTRGFNALTGSMGTYIQPRTKGAGHGSTSRAFYARKIFLAQFIALNPAIDELSSLSF
jgi:DNA mismatch repair protein MutH